MISAPSHQNCELCLRASGLQETAAVEGGELGHQRVETLALASVGVFGFLDLDAALLGKLLDGFDEG